MNKASPFGLVTYIEQHFTPGTFDPARFVLVNLNFIVLSFLHIITPKILDASQLRTELG